MNRTAVVTGADRGLGLALVKALAQRGWTVVAGHLEEEFVGIDGFAADVIGRMIPVQMDVGEGSSIRKAVEQVQNEVDSVDLIINNAGILGKDDISNTIRDGLNYPEITEAFKVNTLGPLRVVQEFIDLMKSSSMKRLCFISSEASSIGWSKRTAWFGYCMSKTALNMGVSILFNDLRGDGFTFRLYHPGWMKTFMKGKEDLEAEYTPDEAADFALEYFLSENGEEESFVLKDILGNVLPW